MTETFLTLTSRLDKDLASHISHVTRLANRIGENAGLTATKLVSVKEAALLHDIGNIFIPEEIIHNNPGPLAKSEESVIRRHPLLGKWHWLAFHHSIKKRQSSLPIMRNGMEVNILSE